MSMDYDIKAITSQPITEEIILNIVNNAKAIGGFHNVEFSPNPSTRNKVELGEALAHVMWLKYEAVGFTGLSWHFFDCQRNVGADFGIGLDKIDNDFVAVEMFQLGGCTRVGRESGLGINFHFYVEKLLQLTNPLSIVRFYTVINDDELYQDKKVDFWVVEANFQAYQRPEMFNGIPLGLTPKRAVVEKLIQNAHQHNIVIDNSVDNLEKNKSLIFKVTTASTKVEFNLKLWPGGIRQSDLVALPLSPESPKDLRSYLQALIDLTQDFDMGQFYADNGKNPNLPR